MTPEVQPREGKCFIDGQWTVGKGAAWQRYSPIDERLLWQGEWADASQLESALEAARRVFPDWAESKLEQRMETCKQFAEYINEHKQELAECIARETGKPLWEARTEAAAAASKVTNSIEALLKRRWTTMEQAGDLNAVTRFRPHGVMLVLGPFNLPAHLPGAHIVPALLAGNTIVFKPSELAPCTGEWLVEAWQQVGLPAGVLNLVHGAAELAIAAAQHAQVDGVLFTGSQRAGTSLHKLLAGQPQKVLALEMGGNNPLVVHNTSDYRAAAITIILSAFITSGQRCTCARRLIISGDTAYERLMNELEELLPKIRVGLPFDDEPPFMGPLIGAAAAENMLQAQADFEAAGGDVRVRMHRSPTCRALVGPALIGLDRGLPVDDCEHFGPLLLVQRARDLDDAIGLAGNTQFGLSAGFIGERVEDFHYFLHRMRAGIINWNRQTTGATGKLPFGGVGLSGNHRPSGYFAADYCSYPVASLESHELTDAEQPIPGLEF